MPFTVTLSGPATSPVTVSYATADLSAHAGIDYVAATGTLTIPAGQTTGTINVTILSGPANQSARFFGLTLSNPTNAALTTATAFRHDSFPSGIGDDVQLVMRRLSSRRPEILTMPFTVTLSEPGDLASHSFVRDLRTSARRPVSTTWPPAGH